MLTINSIGDMDNIADDLRESIRAFLLKAVQNGRNVALDLDISTFGEANDTVLGNAVHAIAKRSQLGRYHPKDMDVLDVLPKTITFPYSRHASYPELCHLVSAFKPKDVWPCTVSPAEWIKDGLSQAAQPRLLNWQLTYPCRQGITIKNLFGSYCSSTAFRHDIMMDPFMETHDASQSQADTQTTLDSADIPLRERNEAGDQAQLRSSMSPSADNTPRALVTQSQSATAADASPHLPNSDRELPSGSNKRVYEDYQRLVGSEGNSQASEVSERAREVRMAAFQAMLGNVKSANWERIGLISTDDNHTMEEDELVFSAD